MIRRTFAKSTFLLALLIWPRLLAAQSDRSELQLRVTGPDGLPIGAEVDLESQRDTLHLATRTGPDGVSSLSKLMYGDYVLRVRAEGCTPQVKLLHFESRLPVRISIQMVLSPIRQSVSVFAQAPLVDRDASSSVYNISPDELVADLSAQPGRDLLGAIDQQPGWLFEANAVPHPRGSEYQTQFLLDGVSRTENLSPSFAAPLPANDVESVQIRTAGYPAEYGRSLGGVIDVATGAGQEPGLHGHLAASGGSFASRAANAALQYRTSPNTLSLIAESYGTTRFLDPPVLENYTNHGTSQDSRLEDFIHLSSSDSLQVNFSEAILHNQVPNEAIQQQAGQLQTRESQQFSGGATYEHMFSPDLLFSTSGNVLESEASLASNASATPLIAGQERGFRQGYLRFDIAGHVGHHDWKAGVDALTRHVHEQFAYKITDPEAFDDGTDPNFQFFGRRWDIEPAIYVQDAWHDAGWNVSLGLRYDRYSFVLHRDGISPRVAASRYIAPLHLLLHGSYDRIFQTPPLENLLLASSASAQSLSAFVVRLPVEPGHANFYEGGFSFAVASELRMTGNVFLRRWINFSDDDTLLNTGISFPFNDHSADIHGEELGLMLPNLHGLSGMLAWSNQVGTATGPIVGGLLLGDEAAESLMDTSRFAISQDQRNTLRATLRWQPKRYFWMSAKVQYNSGLPVDLDDNDDVGGLTQEYGPKILSRVNFVRGRIRPWSSEDINAGVRLPLRERTDATLEFFSANMTNEINLINFASLFSGTAVGTPRSYDGRLSFRF